MYVALTSGLHYCITVDSWVAVADMKHVEIRLVWRLKKKKKRQWKQSDDPYELHVYIASWSSWEQKPVRDGLAADAASLVITCQESAKIRQVDQDDCEVISSVLTICFCK